MSGRTRAELDRERAHNRSVLGLSDGLSDVGIPPGLGAADAFSLGAGLVQGVRMQTSFPETDYTWRPGAKAPDQSSGGASAVADWATRHVVRPKGEIYLPGGQSIAWDPYQDDADYSGLAKIIAAGLAGAAGFGIAWTIVRALTGGAR